MKKFYYKKFCPILLLAGCSVGPIPLPSSETSALHCNKEDCVGVGLYDIQDNDSNTFQKPYASYTETFGQLWQLPDPLPIINNNAQIGFLAKVSCNEKDCIAVGAAQSGDNISPYSALSGDHGKTWRTPESMPTLPDGATSGFLFALTCNGDNCVAGGAVGQEASGRPYTVISSDHGKTWKKPGFTNTSSSGIIYAITCTNKDCIALGFIGDVDENTQPYSVVSDDNGETWQNSATPPPLPSGSVGGSITSVTCNGKNCLAVGGYQDSSEETKPYSVLSEDYGKSWKLSTSSPSPLPSLPDGIQKGSLTSVTCAQDACVAVGSYFNASDIEVPYSVLSDDHGKTWHTPTSPTLPTDWVSGALDSVICNEDECLAIGTALGDSNSDKAFSVSSPDHGKTWPTATIAPAPSNTLRSCFGLNQCTQK